MEAILTSTEELIEHLRSKKNVHVSFIKKNGEERNMHCTLNFDRIPPEHHPKKATATVDSKTIVNVSVFDLEKFGWRSIPLATLNQVKVGDVEYAVDFKE